MSGIESWVLLVAAMVVTGGVAGVMAGLFGIGGGIVIVPVLEATLGFLGVDPAIRMHVAVATSLATIIPTSISSARAHRQRDAVDVDIVRRWALLVLVGALLGAWIASRVDSSALALVFAVTALFVAARTLFGFGNTAVTTDIPRNPLVSAIPLSIGGISTLMGIGGGVMMVMALKLFNQPIHKAIGTAALFGLVISVPGTLGLVAAGWGDPRLPAANLGYVSLVGFAAIAPITVVSAPIGARIAHSLDEKLLNRLFASFLVLASIRLFFRAFA